MTTISDQLVELQETLYASKNPTRRWLHCCVWFILYGIYMIIRTLIFDNPIPGYPSLIVIILFLGGIQLISLGVIGEYLGRTYNESKRRTLYFTKGFHPSQAYKNREQD